MRRARIVGFRRILPALAFAATSFSADAPAQRPEAGPATPIGALDGRSFSGQFVPSGKTSGRPDAFIFSDGKFHSRECLRFGFTPGPYWVRVQNGRLRFLARLTSEENGVMTYEGSIDGARIDARIEWIKPRWYWNMKRDFRFTGASGADATDRGT